MTGATARLFHSRVLRESGSAAEDPSPSSTTAIFAADSSSDFVDLEKDEVVERETAEYACEDDGFLVGDRVYNKQYAHLYYQRLANLSPRIAAKVRAAWPSLPLKKILEVEPGLECAVIGTLYKDMKLKPSVLDDYAKNKSLQPHLAGTKFVSGGDTLVLEDEGARMKLQGSSLRPEDFVSGVCLAVRGVEEEGGHFEVKDVCFAGPGPQTPLPPPPPQQQQQGSGDDKFLCLVSGLNLGAPTQDSLPLQLLVDYVTGGLGDPRADRVARRIARMVVAGNIVAEIPEVPIAEDKVEASKANKAMREADIFLTQIASSMPLDIMPGPSDPANASLPQQPLHRCLLPSTTCYANVGRVTNPHAFSIDKVKVTGTSGQNVDDILKYVDHEDRLGALASTLEWCHTTPTAPDTVACFPFVDQDPFLLKECPHVHFVGNQPKFETGVMEGPQGQRTRLICLPAFSEKQTAVLVNLRDLSCHPLTFSSMVGA